MRISSTNGIINNVRGPQILPMYLYIQDGRSIETGLDERSYEWAELLKCAFSVDTPKSLPYITRAPLPSNYSLLYAE
jgi:hypothetical protein